MAQSQVRVPERGPAVILYAETRGFTRLSEMLDPSVVTAQIGKFFALASAAVERSDGSVVSCLNDTLMAVFTGARDAAGAVQAAQEIQRDFAALAEGWQRDFGIPAAVSMGLHCGEAVIGFSDFGGGERLFVFGDCVSIAERLLHRARAGEFVLSQELIERLAANGATLDAQELPAIEIPRRRPIRIFGVLLDTRLDFT